MESILSRRFTDGIIAGCSRGLIKSAIFLNAISLIVQNMMTHTNIERI